MKKLISFSLLAIAVVGCADNASVTKQTKTSTPGGTTTVTEKTEVEKSGSNPPPAER